IHLFFKSSSKRATQRVLEKRFKKKLFIAAAGSLLGVKVSREKDFPVGKVNFPHLHPLTFFEFLSALGQEKLRSFLEEHQNYEPFP
ncbi:MAG: hypothetical protein P0S93_05205, partial [Candidatus Neptunochlamydia sp.]|nr:hypothetical protein [Candidatus Neptunochlamydia sp.]